jgi:hypothetical protein
MILKKILYISPDIIAPLYSERGPSFRNELVILFHQKVSLKTVNWQLIVIRSNFHESLYMDQLYLNVRFLGIAVYTSSVFRENVRVKIT